MTYLNPNRTLTRAAWLLLASGCSSRIEVASEGTGGTSSVGTASTIGGASSIGTASGVGGATAELTGVGGATWIDSTGVGGATWIDSTSVGGATWIDSTGIAGSTSEQSGTGGSSMTVSTKTSATGTGGSSSAGSTGVGGKSFAGVCTPGADQTCNDDVSMSALAGHCEADGSCTCGTGFVRKSKSGKCTTYDQTVCYSPTQNIDLAYVQRAFGCRCDTVTSPPYCGIDSQGLRVYLFCNSGEWESYPTDYCNGADPISCYSPTENVDHALDSNAIGCSCSDSAAASQCATVDIGFVDLTDGGSYGLPDAGPNVVADAGAHLTVTMHCVDGRWTATAGCN